MVRGRSEDCGTVERGVGQPGEDGSGGGDGDGASGWVEPSSGAVVARTAGRASSAQSTAGREKDQTAAQRNG